MENCKNEIGQKVIAAVLEWVGVAAPTFAKNIGVGYQRVNDIQNGKTKKISQDLANKIISVYPDINMKFLLTGEGEMLVGGVVQRNQHGDNIHGNNVKVDKSESALLDLLKKKDEQIDKLLGIIEKMNK